MINWDINTLKERGLITTGFHLPYNPNLVDLARQMRKNQTEAEKKLWIGLLRDFKFPVLRQRPIDNFIVDFYCAKLKLVIEIDGATHFTDEGRAADRERLEILKGYGLEVIRISDHEVMSSFSMICKKINTFISRSRKL
jgi:very-short-patch-repair endonuclease